MNIIRAHAESALRAVGASYRQIDVFNEHLFYLKFDPTVGHEVLESLNLKTMSISMN